MAEFRWPNLFLIGAPRAGSTAVYNWLSAHPEIYMSPAKEPGFMAVDGDLYDLDSRREGPQSYLVTTIDEYRRLFRGVRDETIVGEATPHYLLDHRAALRIKHYSPHARIAVILRSPAARAYSHYMMQARDAPTSVDFQAAIRVALREESSQPFLDNSFYYVALRRYLEIFPRDRMHVMLYDQMDRDPAAVMQRLYRFLEVDESFQPDVARRSNVSGLPRSRILHRAVMTALHHRLMRVIHLHAPRSWGRRLESWRDRYFERAVRRRSLPRDQELQLNRELFGADISQLEALLELDLSGWLRDS